MISTSLQHFTYLWIIIKNFLLLSWSRAPHSLTPSPGHVLDDESASSRPSSPDSSSTDEDPNEDISYELHMVQVSYNKAAGEEGEVQEKTSFLSTYSSRDDIASAKHLIRRHDSYSTVVDRLSVNARRFKGDYEELEAATFEQVFNSSDSEAGYDVTGRSARDELITRRHYIVDEEAIESDSFDDILPLGHRETSEYEAPDWIQTNPAWANEVANAMIAFRNSTVEGDDPLALRPEENQRLLFERRMSRHKQLQEIQKWRSDTGSEDRITQSPSTPARYSLVPTFQFP